jgi:hypothetical protein
MAWPENQSHYRDNVGIDDNSDCAVMVADAQHGAAFVTGWQDDDARPKFVGVVGVIHGRTDA